MSIDVLVSFEVLGEGEKAVERLKDLLEKGVRLWLTPIGKFLLYREKPPDRVIEFVDSLPEIPWRGLDIKEANFSSDSVLEIEREIARSFRLNKVLGRKSEGDGFVQSPEDLLNFLEAGALDSSPIPLVDLRRQLWEISNEISKGFSEIFSSSHYVQGEFVRTFEEEFAGFVGAPYAVAVNSGTSALILALMALGVSPGDEVIAPAFTFVATAEAISFLGAKPVFVDIEPETYAIDPDKLKEAITAKTKGIVPVHLYGHPADMDPIMEISREHGLFVLEDACQAHGSKYRGAGGWKSAGSIGDAGAFSFYPGKNLGAFGEGGAVTTTREELADRMRSLRDHGSVSKYEHKYVGLNLRLNNFQGVVLLAKIKRLARWNEERRRIAAFYKEQLSDLPLELPKEKEYAYHVYHLYVVKTKERDSLKEFLAKKGVFCGIHYPKPLHLQEAYTFLGHEEGTFLVAEEAAREVLSVPIFQGMRLDEAQRVADAVRSYFGRP